VSSSQAALASVNPLGRVPSPDQPGAPVPSRRLQTLGHPGKSQAVIREDPRDWDYGDYEGLATPDIRASTPGWNMWRDGFPGGEGPRKKALGRIERALSDKPLATLGIFGEQVAQMQAAKLLVVSNAPHAGRDRSSLMLGAPRPDRRSASTNRSTSR
jgi:hypothetical protein